MKSPFFIFLFSLLGTSSMFYSNEVEYYNKSNILNKGRVNSYSPLQEYFNKSGWLLMNYEITKNMLFDIKVILNPLYKELNFVGKKMNAFKQLFYDKSNRITNQNIQDSKATTLLKLAELNKECSNLDKVYELEKKIFEEKIKNHSRQFDTIVLKETIKAIQKGYQKNKYWELGFKQIALRFSFNNKAYLAILVNSKMHDVVIHSNSTKQLQPLEYTWNKLGHNKTNSYLSIMNAGMYLKDGSPQGLLITQGKKIKEIDKTEETKNVNFYMQPNGIFFVDSAGNFFVMKTKDFITFSLNKNVKVLQATQSGPMLVIDESIHASFKYDSKYVNIRNGVGILKSTNHKDAVFVISEEPVTLYEFGLVFKDLFQCDQALYLDGAISKMYINDNGKSFGQLDGELGPVLTIQNKR
jgi:uncharacterized protein YigE (DUF2233 family)